MEQVTAEKTVDWSLKSFLASPRAVKPDDLVESLVPETSVTMLAAAPGLGKSFLMLGLGLAVTRGEDFAGLKTKRSPALFIGEDAPAWDYAGQLRKLLGDGSSPADFHIAANEQFRLLDPAKRATLGEYVRRHSIRLVIVDTLRAVHDSDENDSRQMQAVMNELRAISVEYGLSVLFLHHSPKPSSIGTTSDYRGSSVLLGSCDFYYSMTALKFGKESRLTLQCKKGRGADTPAVLTLRLAWGKPPAVIARVGEADTRADLPTQVIAKLQKGPSCVAEIVASVDAEGRAPKTIREKVDKVLKALRESGVATYVLEGGKNIWNLVPETQEAVA